MSIEPSGNDNSSDWGKQIVDGFKQLTEAGINELGRVVRGSMPATFLIINRPEEIGGSEELYTISAIHIPGDGPIHPYVPHTSVSIDRSLKGNLVEKLEKTTRLDEVKAIGRNLYTHLVDTSIRDFLKDQPPEDLIIVSNEQEVPWEFMFDDELWAHKYNVGRLINEPIRQVKKRQRRDTKGVRILLISDPESNLDSNEAEMIQRELSKNQEIFRVHGIEGKKATKYAVRDEINNGNYDIVHFICHADSKTSISKEIGYIRLSDGILTAPEIARLDLDHYTYPLIFVNACASADMNHGLKKAEMLATAFISSGALSYIGTLSPVPDDLAAKFAVSFYENIYLNDIGNAMKSAHRTIRDKKLVAPYSLYGDPRRFLVKFQWS